MEGTELKDIFERSPVIASVYEENFKAALESPCEVLFDLKASILTVTQRIQAAHQAGKKIFVHIDLASGIGKDRAGIEFLAKAGADGIISTRGQLIRQARDFGLYTVQRFFALDSQGINSIHEMLESVAPDMIELMPGVIGKIIKSFAQNGVSVIAGGLIETKSEVTEVLACGATAVSTGTKELWYI